MEILGETETPCGVAVVCVSPASVGVQGMVETAKRVCDAARTSSFELTRGVPAWMSRIGGDPGRSLSFAACVDGVASHVLMLPDGRVLVGSASGRRGIAPLLMLIAGAGGRMGEAA